MVQKVSPSTKIFWRLRQPPSWRPTLKASISALLTEQQHAGPKKYRMNAPALSLSTTPNPANLGFPITPYHQTSVYRNTQEDTIWGDSKATMMMKKESHSNFSRLRQLKNCWIGEGQTSKRQQETKPSLSIRPWMMKILQRNANSSLQITQMIGRKENHHMILLLACTTTNHRASCKWFNLLGSHPKAGDLSDQCSIAMGMKDNDSHIVVKGGTIENSPSIDPIQIFFFFINAKL